jgi:uncharacterized protein with HEPN domain
MRSVASRLNDMLEAIADIEECYPLNWESFQADKRVQALIVHRLIIIGEAANGIPRDLQTEFPDIPWSGIIGMRNMLVHGYFATNTRVVWRVVEQDLAPLKAQLEHMLAKLGQDGQMK